MCEGKTSCQRPKNLMNKPEDCSVEQIKKCHGEVKEHPCNKKIEKNNPPLKKPLKFSAR